jgi:hypothetical protein
MNSFYEPPRTKDLTLSHLVGGIERESYASLLCVKSLGFCKEFVLAAAGVRG